MPSKREQVLDALKALVVDALPNAEVERNGEADRTSPGGRVNIRDGDPGEPEVFFSPLTYTYSHRIVLEVSGYASGARTRAQVLDDMLTPVGAAIAADRTLGGLCEWLEPEAPTFDDVDPVGSQPLRWAPVTVIAVYSTPDPLS